VLVAAFCRNELSTISTHFERWLQVRDGTMPSPARCKPALPRIILRANSHSPAWI